MANTLVTRAKHTALAQVRDYGSDVYEKRSTAACRSGGGGGGYTPGFNGHDYTSKGRWIPVFIDKFKKEYNHTYQNNLLSFEGAIFGYFRTCWRKDQIYFYN